MAATATTEPVTDPCEGVQQELNHLAVSRRGVVAVAGMWASAAFWLTLRIPTEPVIPLAWPFLFGTTAILTLAVLARPESKRLHWWMTAIGLVSVGLRPSVAFTKWALLGTSTIADVGFSVSVYTLIGYLWLRFSAGPLRAWRFHAIARHLGS